MSDKVNGEKVNGEKATSIYSSPIFKVVAGKESRVFFVHAGVLVKSEHLRAVVEGEWKEGFTKKIVWKEWESDTVDHLVEWLYSGDYTCPFPTERVDDEENSVSSRHSDHPEEDSAIQPNWESDGDKPVSEEEPVEKPSTNNPESRPLSPLENDLIEISPRNTQAQDHESWFKEHDNQLDDMDFGITFLTHAKLYVLAGFLMLPTLEELSLQRLRETLISLGDPSPDTPTIENILELIQYTYDNTGSSSSGEEPLRKLVSTFATLNLWALKGSALDELVSKGGDFVVDITRKATRRIDNLEKSVREPNSVETGFEVEKPNDIIGIWDSSSKKSKLRKPRHR